MINIIHLFFIIRCNKSIINIDTIRRIRAKIQENHPELVDEKADNARRKRQFLFLRALQSAN